MTSHGGLLVHLPRTHNRPCTHKQYVKVGLEITSNSEIACDNRGETKRQARAVELSESYSPNFMV
jgi:hypothetical protein